MAKKKTNKKRVNKKQQSKQQVRSFVKANIVNNQKKYIWIVILLLSILGILQTGLLGETAFNTIKFFFGSYGFFILLYIAIFAILKLLNRSLLLYNNRYGRLVNLLFISLFLMTGKIYYTNNTTFMPDVSQSISMGIEGDSGLGVIGFMIYNSIYVLLGETGLKILTAIVWIAIATNLFNLKKYAKQFIEFLKQQYLDATKDKRVKKSFAKNQYQGPRKAKEKVKTPNLAPVQAVKPTAKVKPEKKQEIRPIIAEFDNREYNIPEIKLLNEYGTDNETIKQQLITEAELKIDNLINALQAFNAKVRYDTETETYTYLVGKERYNSVTATVGPNVTQYRVVPDTKTKVSKFNSISNDIALTLAAQSVRIQAPIPGEAVIGIEIPNSKALTIGLRAVLESEKNDMNDKLQVGLGKDINDHSAFLQINKTPHMLVAGSTGSGKSVCVNAMIISILTKASPDDVKLILIDPKKVELTPFNGIPHLLTPVVTEPQKAASILKKMVAEMEYRYDSFAKTNTRNIEGYNKKTQSKDNSLKKLPYIVIVVDELADLMMVAAKDVEESIARLAQMARAAGIHMIIATQRPSTDVITGLIKANIPTRIAFAVSSSIDSRTILDSTGAEKLLGKGDMLLSRAGGNSFERIQGAFIDDDEVMEIVETITAQFPEDEITNQYAKELETEDEQSIDQELDELYYEVQNNVILTQRASASQIQRDFRVGFNRAMRIMEQLEANGIIAASEGTKPRKVLVEELDENN